MLTQCAVFIATSLDGFIARTDGSIDWLNEAPLPSDLKLQHESTKVFEFGFVQSEYVVHCALNNLDME